MKVPNAPNTNQELANHIKKNVAKGYSIESLKYSLLQQGYSRTTIEKAIEIVKKQLPSARIEVSQERKIATISDEEMKRKVAEQDAQNQGFFKKLFGKWFG